MPRNTKKKLTWQPDVKSSGGRWKKKYKLKVHYFSGGRGKTDEEAYKAALRKWEKKKAEIDADDQQPRQAEYDRIIGEWEGMLTASRLHDDEAMVEIAEEKLAKLRINAEKNRPPPIDREDTIEGYLEKHVKGTLYIKQILTSGSGRARIHALEFPAEHLPKSLGGEDKPGPLQTTATRHAILTDRLEGVRKSSPPPGKTLKDYIEIFLKQKAEEVDAELLSKGRLGNLQTHLRRFESWAGKQMSVKDISEQMLLDYRLDLLKEKEGKKLSPNTAKDHMSTVRMFIQHLFEIRVIDTLPRNMQGNSKALAIKTEPSEIIVYTTEEITTLLSHVSERTKLYILLMLNCGMTQKDIADLLLSDIDWEAGYIERKRSKTKKHKNVPTVKYRLWPETLRLLKQERNRAKTGLALLNENGVPLKRERIGPDGKYSKTDDIRSAYDRVRKKTNISKTLKMFRKTSATLIGDHLEYSGLADLFLGHAPRTVAERHYTLPPQERLDRAVTWLGEEYGIVQKQSPNPNDLTE